MPDENLSFLWNLLSQSGIRERSDRMARLAQGISLSLGKQRELAEQSSWAASTWVVFVSGIWACGIYIQKQGKDSLKTKGLKKNLKKTIDPIQTVIGREKYGMEKIHRALCLVHKIYPNYISWIKLWISLWFKVLDLGLPQITMRTHRNCDISSRQLPLNGSSSTQLLSFVIQHLSQCCFAQKYVSNTW